MLNLKMWQLEDWVLAIGHQEVQMWALAPHRAGLHMTKKRNTKVGETKEMMTTVPKTTKNKTFNTMRLVCHSSTMLPNQVKVPPVVHVHKGRVDRWTGTLQGHTHLVGAK
jgi:hypothetical protein